MKIYKFFLIAIVSLAACSKDDSDNQDFNVSTASQTYKVGETVTFNINGNPDNLTFFSGEQGFNYDFIDRKSATGVPILQFTSSVQFLTPDNSLRLLISKNFSGENDSTAIVNATWTDITSKATFATGTTVTQSGRIDLSEFLSATDSVTIAFRYRDIPKTITTLRQATWTMSGFNLVNELTDRSFNTILMSENAWGIRSFGSNSTARWTSSATQLVMTGGTTLAAANDDWIYSKKVLLNTAIADVGKALKNVSTRIDRHQHVYSTPGNYKVTFVGSTNRPNNQGQIVKSINITIAP
jgi:hypothetical protein